MTLIWHKGQKIIIDDLPPSQIIYKSRNWLGIKHLGYHHHSRLQSHVHYTFFWLRKTIKFPTTDIDDIIDQYPHLSMYVDGNKPKNDTYCFHLINARVSGLETLFIDSFKSFYEPQRKRYC